MPVGMGLHKGRDHLHSCCACTVNMFAQDLGALARGSWLAWALCVQGGVFAQGLGALGYQSELAQVLCVQENAFAQDLDGHLHSQVPLHEGCVCSQGPAPPSLCTPLARGLTQGQDMHTCPQRSGCNLCTCAAAVHLRGCSPFAQVSVHANRGVHALIISVQANRGMHALITSVQAHNRGGFVRVQARECVHMLARCVSFTRVCTNRCACSQGGVCPLHECARSWDACAPVHTCKCGCVLCTRVHTHTSASSWGAAPDGEHTGPGDAGDRVTG